MYLNPLPHTSAIMQLWIKRCLRIWKLPKGDIEDKLELIQAMALVPKHG